MVMIDAHVHAHRPGNPQEGFTGGPDWDAPVERLLGQMDATGVDKAVLVPINPDPANDQYLKDSMEAYPGRFAGIGVHDPSVADQGADYARRADTYGIQGLRVKQLGGGTGTPVEELPIFSLCEELERRGHNLWYYGQVEDIDLLPAILDRLPNLKVGINSVGLPSIDPVLDEHHRPTRFSAGIPPATLPGVLEAAKYETVHVMLGCMYQLSPEPHPHTDLRGLVQQLYAAYGASRLFWNSDWPWIEKVPGYDAMPEIIDANLPDLSAEERAEIFGGTASRLFKF